LIVTMMGFHAVKLWQNEFFHCRDQMNIAFRLSMGKKETNCSVDFVAEKLTTLKSK
jgi:hypothetical protein